MCCYPECLYNEGHGDGRMTLNASKLLCFLLKAVDYFFAVTIFCCVQKLSVIVMCHSTKCHNDVGHGANIRKPRSMKLTKHNGFMRDLIEYIFPVAMLYRKRYFNKKLKT